MHLWEDEERAGEGGHEQEVLTCPVTVNLTGIALLSLNIHSESSGLDPCDSEFIFSALRSALFPDSSVLMPLSTPLADLSSQVCRYS